MSRARGTASGGFVLLAVAGVLLAGSAVASLYVPRDGAAPRPGRALDELTRLVAARDALLAYTTIYPELYGPGGAGPGHLPCPDTDDSFRLAGPNPPCGRAVSGRLPAHVTVSSTRVGLDVAAGGAPIGYRVGAAVANNPARRPLVPEAGGAGSRFRDPDTVAELALTDDGGTTLSIEVRASELLAAAERRVAAWVVSEAGSTGAAPGTDVDADAAPRPGEVDVLGLVTRRVPSTVADGTSVDLVEGIPQARHWFVEDGWPAVFRASVSRACLDAVRACAWRSDDSARRTVRTASGPEGSGATAELPPIELERVPVDAPGDRPVTSGPDDVAAPAGPAPAGPDS